MDPQGPNEVVDNINTVLGHRAGVLGLVFRLLVLRDLKNVSLVCGGKLGERVLWVREVLRVTREDMASVVEVLAGSRRLQGVRQASLVGQTVPNELLQAMERKRGLRSVNMANSNLTEVEPELLATAVTGWRR